MFDNVSWMYNVNKHIENCFSWIFNLVRKSAILFVKQDDAIVSIFFLGKLKVQLFFWIPRNSLISIKELQSSCKLL